VQTTNTSNKDVKEVLQIIEPIINKCLQSQRLEVLPLFLDL